MNLYPLKFSPLLKSTLWGGTRLKAYKQLPDPSSGTVGESWEVSGVEGSESVIANGPLRGHTLVEAITRFGPRMLGTANHARFGNEVPLLVKFIDAREDLSIQVHPDERMAQRRHGKHGKTEMWYVIDALPGSRLRVGLSRPLTPDECRARMADGSIVGLLEEYEVKAGDVFFLPAGRIHSIGAGMLIAEIQQTSDVTYRIFDFNRRDAGGHLRELHTGLAAEAIDYRVLADYRTPYTPVENRPVQLVRCPCFTTGLWLCSRDASRSYADGSFHILVCVEGRGALSVEGQAEVPLGRGETLFLPAEVEAFRLRVDQPMKIVETYIGK